MSTSTVAVTVMLGWTVATCQTEQVATTQPTSRPANVIEAVRSGVKTGELCFRLTTPAEMKALLGPPSKERTKKEGGGKLLIHC